jgi:hypothetical protein
LRREFFVASTRNITDMSKTLVIATILCLSAASAFSQILILSAAQDSVTTASGFRRSNPLVVIKAGDKTAQIPPATTSRHSFSNLLQEIDPSWIQSVTVLKDQQAIDKYGALGTYGVIILEVKDGTFNKMPPHVAERFH